LGRWFSIVLKKAVSLAAKIMTEHLNIFVNSNRMKLAKLKLVVEKEETHKKKLP